MREFRTHLPQYLLKSLPVAITRHGETIGFYIPTRRSHGKVELEALKKAASKLEKLLSDNNITEDELFEDFRILRQEERKS